MLKKIIKKYYFTLFEILIVITILGIILGIASLTLPKWIQKTRDSKRIGDMNIIISGLENYYYENNFYPTPDDYISIGYGQNNLSFQGTAGSTVSKKINLKATPTDPIDSIPYTYSISNDKQKYQILSYLETDDVESGLLNDTNTYLNNTFAKDYSKKFISTKGDKIGILLSGGSFGSMNNFGESINLSGSNDLFYVYFSNNDYYYGTGEKLLRAIGIYNKDVSKFDEKLLFYLSFENSNKNILTDDSKNSFTGEIINGPIIYEGIYGKGVKFVNNGNITFSNSGLDILNLTGNFTVSLRLNIFENPLNSGNIYNKGGVSMYIENNQLNFDTGNIRLSHSIEFNKRLNIVITYDQTGINLFINGERIKNEPYYEELNNYENDFVIGDDDLNGIIDEFRIYNGILSLEDIKLLYKSIKG